MQLNDLPRDLLIDMLKKIPYLKLQTICSTNKQINRLCSDPDFSTPLAEPSGRSAYLELARAHDYCYTGIITVQCLMKTVHEQNNELLKFYLEQNSGQVIYGDFLVHILSNDELKERFLFMIADNDDEVLYDLILKKEKFFSIDRTVSKEASLTYVYILTDLLRFAIKSDAIRVIDLILTDYISVAPQLSQGYATALLNLLLDHDQIDRVMQILNEFPALYKYVKFEIFERLAELGVLLPADITQRLERVRAFRNKNAD